MLCDLCTAVFAFDRTDAIMWMKKDAIREAEESNSSAVQIEILRRERERYQAALEAAHATQVPPSPWDAKESLDVCFRAVHFYTVWQGEERRLWQELKKSASQNGCALCETLAAMIQDQASFDIGDRVYITGGWFLDHGGLNPSWICFEVTDGDNDQTLFVVRLHVVVEADGTGELGSCSRLFNIKY
jgi:hypothetical protein